MQVVKRFCVGLFSVSPSPTSESLSSSTQSIEQKKTIYFDRGLIDALVHSGAMDPLSLLLFSHSCRDAHAATNLESWIVLYQRLFGIDVITVPCHAQLSRDNVAQLCLFRFLHDSDVFRRYGYTVSTVHRNQEFTYKYFYKEAVVMRLETTVSKGETGPKRIASSFSQKTRQGQDLYILKIIDTQESFLGASRNSSHYSIRFRMLLKDRALRDCPIFTLERKLNRQSDFIRFYRDDDELFMVGEQEISIENTICGIFRVARAQRSLHDLAAVLSTYFIDDEQLAKELSQGHLIFFTYYMLCRILFEGHMHSQRVFFGENMLDQQWEHTLEQALQQAQEHYHEVGIPRTSRSGEDEGRCTIS